VWFAHGPLCGWSLQPVVPDVRRRLYGGRAGGSRIRSSPASDPSAAVVAAVAGGPGGNRPRWMNRWSAPAGVLTHRTAIGPNASQAATTPRGVRTPIFGCHLTDRRSCRTFLRRSRWPSTEWESDFVRIAPRFSRVARARRPAGGIRRPVVDFVVRRTSRKVDGSGKEARPTGRFAAQARPPMPRPPTANAPTRPMYLE